MTPSPDPKVLDRLFSLNHTLGNLQSERSSLSASLKDVREQIEDTMTKMQELLQNLESPQENLFTLEVTPPDVAPDGSISQPPQESP